LQDGIIRGVRSLEETTRHLVGGFNFSRVIIPEKRAYRQTHLAALSLICRHYANVFDARQCSELDDEEGGQN